MRGGKASKDTDIRERQRQRETEMQMNLQEVGVEVKTRGSLFEGRKKKAE